MASPAIAKDDDEPPEKTETSEKCKDAEVWDKEKKECVEAEKSAMTDDQLYDAVRELAYDGQYERSLKVVAAMSDQNDDRVWTYKGFNTRKMGDMNQGMAYYQKALEVNPNNILVRSYMGQALVEQGKIKDARIQLAAIKDAGGEGTWSEQSLQKAIKSGRTYGY
jgi:Tfp pilus assembly protein PilF